MNRFANSSVQNYYSSLIANTTDECRPIFHGVSRGNVSSRYSWIADMLHKHPGNSATNTHRAHVSFFSDQEMIRQEYAFDPDLVSAYPFLVTRSNQILPSTSYELSSKQYARVGQKRSEVDSVDYINESILRVWLDGTNKARTIHVNHDYANVGIYHAEGYRVRWGGTNPYKGYSESLFVKNGRNFLKKSGASFDISLLQNYADINTAFDENLGWSSVEEALAGGHPLERFCDYKIDMANQESQRFIDQNQWVMYPPQYMIPVSDGYVPSIGIVSCYGDDGAELAREYPTSIPMSIFFPEIVVEGQYEPFKVITDFYTGYGGTSGKMYLNPMCCMGDSSDQSRLVFNICKYQATYDISTYEMAILRRKNSITYLEGIDLEAERNRRLSSVVMTEPYFVAKPICRGELAYYQFVDQSGIPVSYDDPSDFNDNPTMFLRIKASSSMISEIEKALIVDDRNSDIIHTLTMKLEDAQALLPTSATYYESFNGTGGEFFERQDDCLDDLVGQVFTARNYYKFYISLPSSAEYSAYTDLKARVVGMGASSVMVQNQNGSFSPENRVHFYCSNHVITAPAPAGDDGDPTPPANIDVELVGESDYTSFSSVTSNERFRPMVKVPGINGYVKIVGRSQAFSVRRADDGNLEVVYHVEFPYCPGSYIIRSTLGDANADYQPTQILVKESYINAGSFGLDGSTYDTTNLRHQFSEANAVLTAARLYQQSHEDVETAIESDGGGLRPQSKKTITYPARIVHKISKWNLFDVVKPMYPSSSHHTTIRVMPDKDTVGWDPVGMWSYGDVAKVDLKLVVFSDNQRWKFDQNKYCSFIGRENPSYLFEIDSRTLFNNYGLSDNLGCGIPDFKRWCYGYLTGNTATFIKTDQQELDDGDRLIMADSERTLLSLKSGSSLILEAWDHGAGSGCWRPMCQTGFDDNKIPGETLVGELHFVEVLAYPAQLNLSGTQFHKIRLGIIRLPSDLNDPDDTYSPKFPPETDVTLFANSTNRVLYNSETNQSFHIAHSFYDVTTSVDNPDYVDVIVNMVDSDGTVVDPNTLPGIEYFLGWTGKLQLRASGRQMSKGVFEMAGAEATGSATEGYVKRYMDMRDDEPGGDVSRYVDDSGIIRIRARIARNRQYPISFDTRDVSHMQVATAEDEITGEIAPNAIDPWLDSMGATLEL